MPTQTEKVNRYYDATVFDYSLLWTGKKDLAMHFGYYDAPRLSHTDALLRMNAHLAERGRITPSDRVIDAGCGYGGTALWLARHIGCEVVGLNIVPYQVAKARSYARRRGLSGRVRFLEADYTHTGLEDTSFTVALGLESIVHAADKAAFASEMFRLLHPGGRIVISEYMLRDNPALTHDERASLRPWLDGWAMPNLLTPHEYQTILETAGFADIEIEDITEQVLPSLRRLARFIPLGSAVGRTLQSIGLFSDAHFGNITATQCQMESLGKGYWRYVVVTAIKR